MASEQEPPSKEPINRSEAVSWLFLHSLSTSFAYILYVALFQSTPWLIVVVWMFLTTFLYYLVREKYIFYARLVFRETRLYVIWATISTLVYWYTFWYALSLYPEEAAVALAFLALMIFGTPAALKLTTAKNAKDIDSAYWIAGGCLFVGILFMKIGGDSHIGGNLADIYSTTYWSKVYSRFHGNTVVLFLIVVAMQASNAVCRDHYKKRDKRPSQAIEMAGLLNSKGNLAYDAPTAISCVFCAVISIIVLLIGHLAGWIDRAPFEPSNLAILIMGVFGILIPIVLSNYLVDQRELDPALLESWLALRPILYFLMAVAVSWILSMIGQPATETTSIVSLWGMAITLNAKLQGASGEIFWLGAIICTFSFIVLIWSPLQTKHGFAAENQSDKLSVE